MVRFLELQSLFSYRWDQVAQAFWQRYPNPHSSHVLSEDTLDREIRDGKLYSKRILVKTNRVPKWGERLVGRRNVVCVVEESIIDPLAHTITTYTRNIGLTRLMSVDEKVVYRPHFYRPDHTQADRCVWVDSRIPGFGGAIRAFGADRFRKNCQKAVLGFEYTLNLLFPKLQEEEVAASPLDDHREKLRETAERAKALARPIYAACQSQDQRA